MSSFHSKQLQNNTEGPNKQTDGLGAHSVEVLKNAKIWLNRGLEIYVLDALESTKKIPIQNLSN